MPNLLRKEKETWTEAPSTWLEEGVLSEESKQYVSNFIAVHRLRPTDGEDEDHSDDLGEAEDEEL